MASKPQRTFTTGATKYAALSRWLVGQRRDRIEVTFSEVETVLGFPLPQSCRDHSPHWYGYRGTAVGRAIRDAGWKAHNVALATERLVLERVRDEDTSE